MANSAMRSADIVSNKKLFVVVPVVDANPRVLVPVMV